jgi:type VI secretion system protein ImpA
MPLRDDLLDPIAGENPAGPDLRYDPVFDKIKNARKEDDESLPAGDWGRSVKRADHLQVIKLAGEALATRTKDLKLASSLVESQFKLEGLPVLAPSIRLLRQLQENFWDTLYPEIDDDGSLDARANEITKATKWMIPTLQELPLTSGGLSPAKYRESRIVGYESAATTDERQDARKVAIEAKKLSAEDFDKAALASPKSFYVQSKAAIDEALEEADLLNRYQKQAYGDQYPELSIFDEALQEAHLLFSFLLAERLRIEPDPPAEGEDLDALEEPPLVASPNADNAPIECVASHRASRKPLIAVALWTPEDAYTQVVRCAQFLFENDAQSPVPYLVCAALRLGETRTQSSNPDPGFAVGPSSEIRQSLKTFSTEGAWPDLLRISLPLMAQPCGRAWLDLRRYIWRAARETEAYAIATAVTGSLRSLLAEMPDVRHWMLEDDTPAANPETQVWIDAEVLPPAPELVSSSMEQEAYITPSDGTLSLDEDSDGPAGIYLTAMQLLRSGRASDAISMMARDAETQSSGRMRFRRRIQLAQMCMAAQHVDVARAVLEDLSQEIARRHLDTWESSELLATPLALLLKCIEGRSDAIGARNALFARLCLLDPRAALSSNG